MSGSAAPKGKSPVWLRYALLLLWMGVIYRASATPYLKAVPWAQRFHLLPLIMGVRATDVAELILRKGAHMFSYGLLAALARWAFAGSMAKRTRWRLNLAGFLLAGLYAATDEFHQTFVPGREGHLTDVLIDAAGAAIGLGLWWLFEVRRRADGSRESDRE